jgi:hypothetical protein
MLEIKLAVLADYSNISREGKLNILGIFDRIYAQNIPATHPQMQLIMTLEADRVDADREHSIAIELIDSDGKKLFTVGGKLEFKPPPPGEHVKLNHAMQLNNLRFDNYGKYEFKVLINNEVRKSIPLSLVEAKKQ